MTHLYVDGDIVLCPKCGSDDVYAIQTCFTAYNLRYDSLSRKTVIAGVNDASKQIVIECTNCSWKTPANGVIANTIVET